MPRLCARDFQHGLEIAVTHGGDSDSTGAIAGNALGLLFPEQVPSHPWADQVECRDIISDISRDLALAMSGRTAELAERYPGY
ncbi:ADP-ribosylglycohydrolase family protein [Paracoccus sp. DMF-8]|uniref:ADP-ribosylglycohydrolase family protein n=1 Tax=Paracoccus sp. DMF-8 TaxID=3019445 RepID=UPI0023E8BC78|nr:ADP-ribosylglycohydrolase family protein [Paracoccus sp. DMF-8]MDF3605770.1 ADP-ribosylglycohydrolase family protein [Paracoccus sp. DMF-8]